MSSADDIDTASTAVTILGLGSSGPTYGTYTPAANHQSHAETRERLSASGNGSNQSRDPKLTNGQSGVHTRGMTKRKTSREADMNEKRRRSMNENNAWPLDAGEDVPLLDVRESPCEKYTSCRWTLAYMGSVLTLMLFCLRNCISMAIVCMSDLEGPTVSVSVVDNSTGENASHTTTNGTIAVVLPVPNYIPASMQGVVLSAYYYGYILTPFLGGVVATRFGPKRMLTVSMATSAALTLLMPVAIRTNIYLTVVLRIVLGFVAGVTMPSTTMLWTQWAPVKEKGTLLTVNMSGSSTGSIVANLVSGFLCSIPLDEGWPFIFYTYGAVALVWVVIWQCLAYDSPSKHPRITEKEKAVIGSRPIFASKKLVKPPLKAIFTSSVFYGMICGHVAYSWIISFVATYLPLYLNDVLRFDVQASGALASLPFVARAILNLVFAVIADRLHTGGVLSVTNNRKLFQTIGLVLPGAMLMGIAFLDPSQRVVSVIMFVILSGLQSACQLGFRLLPLDIAPRFTAPLVGLSVTFGTAVQIISPLVTSAIIADNRPESWSKVFIITSVIAGVGAAIFLVFARAEEQEWAKDKGESNTHGDVISVPDMTSQEGHVVEKTDITAGKREDYKRYRAREQYAEHLTSGEYQTF